MVALKLLPDSNSDDGVVGKQERRGGIETVLPAPGNPAQPLGSRNAVVALKAMTLKLRGGVTVGVAV